LLLSDVTTFCIHVYCSCYIAFYFVLSIPGVGRHHRYGHYGHGHSHSTFRTAMATNSFGHSTFCNRPMYCLHQPKYLQYFVTKVIIRPFPSPSSLPLSSFLFSRPVCQGVGLVYEDPNTPKRSTLTEARGPRQLCPEDGYNTIQ